MSVNRNIGFFHSIVENAGVFSNKNDISIRPVHSVTAQTFDYNNFKAAASIKTSYGSSNTFHWNFHKWGDADNVVSK